MRHKFSRQSRRTLCDPRRSDKDASQIEHRIRAVGLELRSGDAFERELDEDHDLRVRESADALLPKQEIRCTLTRSAVVTTLLAGNLRPCDRKVNKTACRGCLGRRTLLSLRKSCRSEAVRNRQRSQTTQDLNARSSRLDESGMSSSRTRSRSSRARFAYRS